MQIHAGKLLEKGEDGKKKENTDVRGNNKRQATIRDGNSTSTESRQGRLFIMLFYIRQRSRNHSLNRKNKMTSVRRCMHKDKYILKDETTKNNLWWTSEFSKNDNKPIDKEPKFHQKSR